MRKNPQEGQKTVTKILNKTTVLKVIANEKLGFQFGNPERIDEKSLLGVLPILRKTTTKRQYITYPETDGVIATDSGSINKMNLRNTTKENVFLRSGTIFIGKTQERALTRSSVIFPGQEVSLDVRCVHATKGIVSGAEVKYGGLTPLSMESKCFSDGYRPLDQGTYWNQVRCYTSSLRGTTGYLDRCHQESQTLDFDTFNSDHRHPLVDMSLNSDRSLTNNLSFSALSSAGTDHVVSDDLASSMNDFNKSFDNILSKIKCKEDQVGIALMDEKGCQTIELFDVGESWKAIHSDSIRRVGDKVKDKEPQPFQFKKEKALENVRWVLSQDYKMNTIFKHKPINGEPDLEITGITSNTFVGEIVEIDGRVVHLVIIKKAA